MALSVLHTQMRKADILFTMGAITNHSLLRPLTYMREDSVLQPMVHSDRGIHSTPGKPTTLNRKEMI